MFCPICYSSALNLVRKIHGVKIYECRRCGVAVILPKNQEIINKNLYSFEGYKTQEKQLKKRLSFLGKTIIRFKKSGKLLDVGAGFGQFSGILDKLGKYDIEVIEPLVKTEYLRNTKHKLHIKKYEDYLSAHPVCGRHDLILMMDILEHFKNPLKILNETRKLISKNGYLVIQTPNYKSLMAKICKNWSWWMVKDHKLIFSPKSIRLILKKTGYRIVYFKTYEDLYDFKKNLDGNFTNKILKGFFYLIFFPFYIIFRHILWYFSYGGAIFLIAKRYS